MTRSKHCSGLAPPVASLSSPATGWLVEGDLGTSPVPRVPGGLAVGGLGVLDHVHGGVVSADGLGVGGGVAAGGAGGSAGSGLSLSGEVVVEAVETLGLGAVEVEPPVADEVVLVEDGSVGAEEAVLGQTTGAVSGADVEDLALGLGVGVVP